MLYHDAPIVAEEVEDGVDVNLEFRFRSPAVLADIGSPEPVLGGTLNSEGDTSRVYAGLAWTADLSGSLFLSGVAGGAVHDGALHATEPGRKALGRAFCSIWLWNSASGSMRITTSRFMSTICRTLPWPTRMRASTRSASATAIVFE